MQTFGKIVTKNSSWLFENALILKKRTVDIRYELDRTRDGTEDRHRLIDVDIK